ncbi:MAG: S8 family serine peptidase, partial [Acidimicrobiaceae bacterium]|nr:S8 family serine peptidase [Acidimicrobiaceae bacterium]
AQEFYLRAGGYVYAALRWDDTWGGAAKDLDIEVKYSTTRGGTQSVVGFSADPQSGGASHYPYEGARLTVNQGGNGYYSFYVKKKTSSDAPSWVQVVFFTSDVPQIDHYTLSGGITSPADSAHAGVLAVGAAKQSSPDSISPYSSRGPTPDNRTKPDITGVDCAPTKRAQEFCGTSQAAPHIAGLAALVIDRYPTWTPQQVATYLKTNAEDRGTTGADNTWGHGFALLPSAGLTPVGDGCTEALEGSGIVQSNWSSTWCQSQGRHNAYARYFTFSLDSAASVTIDLVSSQDTYMFLRRGLDQRSESLVARDDDSGNGFNSRISRTLSAGDYTIEATTYLGKRSAPFTLTVAGVPNQNTEPVVSVTAGSGVTEGGDASFTVSASPVPSAPLSVSVSVSQTGDFGVTTGSRTVTVPTSGSVLVTVATSDDDIDEVDGSVSVTVNGGSTYTVSGIAGSATVNVADDDDPPPASDGCTVALAGSGTVQGRWDSSCGSVERTGRNARFFTFSLDASANVRIDLESSYDTYLFLRRGLDQRSGSYVARDDDGGNGYNSRIARTLSAGDYTIEATTFRGSRSGPFTLRVSGVPAQRLIQVKPQVSVTAGVGITEGANASFTVTASPAPSAPLSVSVGVAQSGDFGVTTGSRTVTVPTSGTATVTVSTSGDDTDEDDGSVTVTVASGSGYTVSGIAGSASVNVADDDDPPPVTPEVSVAAGAGVTEGANASFTVAASPAPSAPLSVSVTVAQTGDFGVSTGSRTVTVPTTGSVTVTVSTSDDDTDEVGGSVTVTINSGSAYTVSDNGGRATVNVADDDDPPVTSDGCTQALTGSGSVSHRWDSSCGSVERSNRYARFYTFSLNNSALVRIDLESSQDTYLYLRRGLDERSSRLVVRDDDSGVGLNSRIVRTLSAGDYTIEATTYSVRRSGAFTLRVSGVPAQNPNQVIPQLSVAAGVG